MPWFLAIIAAAGIWLYSQRSSAASTTPLLPPGPEPEPSQDPAGLIRAGYRTWSERVARDAQAYAATLSARGVDPRDVGIPASWAQIRLELLARAEQLAAADEERLVDAIRVAVAERGPEARAAGAEMIWWARDGRAHVELFESGGSAGQRLSQEGRAWLTLIHPDGSYYTVITGPAGELIEVTQ